DRSAARGGRAHPAARGDGVTADTTAAATTPAVTTSPLVIDDVSAGYGDTQVLWDVSMRVDPGEIVALIGSNGAGKSTLLGAISGVVSTWGGGVRYGERSLTGLEPDRIVQAGV